MQITSPELRKLDARVAEFYKLNARYMGSLANIYGRRVYKAEVSELQKIMEGIKPESEFDELVLRNIRSNVKISSLVMDYFVDMDFPLSVEEFFDKISGEGAWNYLEDNERTVPWELSWRYDGISQKRNFSKISSLTDEAQEAAKSWLPRIKRDILEYGKAEGYLPEDFDMNLFLLPARDGMEFSSWRTETNTFNLGSYGFDVFLKNGKVVANPTKAYGVAFHEVLGHAAHQIYSANMPLSLRDSEEIGSTSAVKPVSEGIAIDRARGSYKFLRERLDELGITEEDVRLVEMYDGWAVYNRCNTLYNGLLKDKELRENFDGYKHILDITNNPILAKSYGRLPKGSGFSDVWLHFGHAMGERHYQKMLDKVKDKFGDVDEKKLNRASATGIWSWEVYPDAVCYFLERM